MIAYLDFIAKWQRGEAIVCAGIGNSIMYGNRADNSWSIPDYKDNPLVPSWANQLRAFLQAKNPSNIFYNMSNGGWTAKTHIDNNSVAIIAGYNPKPELCFVALQINEYNQALGPYSWDDFNNNLTTLVNQLKAQDITPVLVKESWINWDERTLRADGKTYPDFVAQIDVLAQQLECEVLDTYTPFYNAIVAAGTWQDSGLLYEGIHPVQAGHDLILTQYITWWEQDVNEPGEPVPTTIYRNTRANCRANNVGVLAAEPTTPAAGSVFGPINSLGRRLVS